MSKLINTIIEDAKPGMYVCRNCKNPYQLKDYPPKEYVKAAKVVWFCYDDGVVERKGISEEKYDEYLSFTDDDEIQMLVPSINFFTTLYQLNSDLIYGDIITFLEDLDNNCWTFKKEELSPHFNELVEYLRTIDIYEEPKPWDTLGFVYAKYTEEDGRTAYDIRGIERKARHRMIEG